ncbi:MAG: hypothetical protein ACR2PI_03665 [Hyphomicrobiaceae bacterium]
MQWVWVRGVTVILMALVQGAPPAAQAETLPGRLITFKKTFDGWWDVACDTAPNGSDARCYVQYVDPYRVTPKLRAVMVDFLYRRADDGDAEPVITFDVEPDLSFARDVRLAIVGADGTEKEIAVSACTGGKCVFAGGKAKAMLIRWSGAKRLRLRIREHGGEIVVREWPLGNMREIVRLIGEQRKVRGLP